MGALEKYICNLIKKKTYEKWAGKSHLNVLWGGVGTAQQPVELPPVIIEMFFFPLPNSNGPGFPLSLPETWKIHTSLYNWVLCTDVDIKPSCSPC